MSGLACLPEITVKDKHPDDDRDLLHLMQAGVEQGFVMLYRKYQPSVFRFCLHVSGSQHVAEEVTQDTFVTFLRKPESYKEGRGPLLLYLFGIARYLVWKGRRRSELFTSLEEKGSDLPVTGPDLFADLAHSERVARIRHAVLALPRKYREVIALCALQELSYEQAAKVVGCSIGTIRSRMHRAKKLLSQKFIEGGLGESLQRSSVLRYEP